MQQVDIVQSRMSLRCSRGKCNYVLAPSCAHSLLEKKVNIIFFYFQPLVYVHNQMYKCRLLITFENSSGPTKCSRENACMCRLVSAFAAREKMFCFSAPICVLNHLLLVSSPDNLFTGYRLNSFLKLTSSLENWLCLYYGQHKMKCKIGWVQSGSTYFILPIMLTHLKCFSMAYSSRFLSYLDAF